MVVELENGLRFIANYRYNIKSEYTADPLVDNSKLSLLDTSSESSFDSQCDATMVGILQDKASNDEMSNFKVSCFIGVQKTKFDIETSEEIDKGDKLK